MTLHTYTYNNIDEQIIREWLNPSNIIIIDKRAHDCLEVLLEMKPVHEMPKFLNLKQPFSTEDAKKTWLVIKGRWFDTQILNAVN